MSTKRFSGKQARFYPDKSPKKKIPGTFRVQLKQAKYKIKDKYIEQLTELKERLKNDNES